jgi:hypothetical protein
MAAKPEICWQNLALPGLGKPSIVRMTMVKG